MVFTLRCPASQCRKYMLIEESDRGRRLNCLVCKQPLDIPTAPGAEPVRSRPTMAIPAPRSIPSTHDRSSQSIPIAKRVPQSKDEG